MADEILDMLNANGTNAADLPEGEDIIVDNSGAAIVKDNEKPEGESDTIIVKDEKPDVSGATKPDFNVGEYFDGYESLDQVKADIERAKSYSPEVETELKELRGSKEKMTTLEKEVGELKSRQPFKNEKYYQLDKLGEQDPEKATIYQNFLFGDKSDENVVKLRMMLEHPQRFKDNPGFLQRHLEAKYPNYFGDEFTSEDVEFQDAKTTLGIDADKGRAEFEAEISKIELPKVKSDEDAKAEDTAFVNSWKEPFKEVTSNITKIEIPVLNEKDSTKTEGFMDFEIPEADIKQVQEYAGNHIYTQRLEPTKENMKAAMDVAKGIYLVKNFAKINTAFANQLEKVSGAKWRKTIHNPVKPGADVNTIVDNGLQKAEEGSAQFILDDINR